MVNMVFYDTAQISRLERAIEESDWFTAIVLAATQLERHGSMVIKDYLQSLKVDSILTDKMLEPLYLIDIAQCLLTMKKIDKKEFNTLMKINTARKHFVHRREKEKIKHALQAEKEYGALASEAIRILKEKLNAVRLFVSR